MNVCPKTNAEQVKALSLSPWMVSTMWLLVPFMSDPEHRAA